MPATIETFTVDPASTAWTPGPIHVTDTQTLIVRASGYAQWSALPKYSQVEGGYPNDGYPMAHHLDPGDTTRPFSGNPVTNANGLSLCILAVGTGVVPGPLTPGGGRGDALVPRWSLDTDGVTRVAIFYPSDMSVKTSTTGPWDIFFGYNDGAYGDNSGSFSVTTIVTDVDLQNPGQILSLPGHVTQDDIDNATFCSASGLLVPGNRQHDLDGRIVADIFAPYKQSGPKEF